MMKKQKLLKPCFVFLLFFTFSMLVIGCGEKGEKKMQTKKVEGTTSIPDVSQVVPISDQIQMEQWMHLVKDIKSTFDGMEEVNKQVLQTRGPR